jgi:hypothetical protein
MVDDVDVGTHHDDVGGAQHITTTPGSSAAAATSRRSERDAPVSESGVGSPPTSRSGSPPALDLRDLRTEIAHQLRRVRARDALGRVDDAEAGECRIGHGVA